MTEKYWEINPKNGFGFINFGATQDAISKYDKIYGSRNAQVSYEDRYSELESVNEQFGFSLTQEQIEELKAAINEESTLLGNPLDEYRNESNLSTTFVNDHLVEIQISRGVPDLHFKGSRFFHTNPREFLAKLQKENGEAPLVSGPDCVFRNIYVYVWSAFEITITGDVRFFNEHDEDAQDKSILLTAQSRNPDEDFSEYKPVNFIVGN